MRPAPLWEFIIRLDDRHDLADLDGADDWDDAEEFFEGFFKWRDEWSGEQRAQWYLAILALRTLAREFTSVRPKRPGLTGDDAVEGALAAANWYLDGLSPVLCRSATMLGPRDGRLHTVLYTRTDARDSSLPDGPVGPEGFLRHIFLSLAPPTGNPGPACKDCGTSLAGVSGKGRPVRRSVCQRCSYQRWKQKHGPDKVRKVWRENQKAQRQDGG